MAKALLEMIHVSETPCNVVGIQLCPREMRHLGISTTRLRNWRLAYSAIHSRQKWRRMIKWTVNLIPTPSWMLPAFAFSITTFDHSTFFPLTSPLTLRSRSTESRSLAS